MIVIDPEPTDSESGKVEGLSSFLFGGRFIADLREALPARDDLLFSQEYSAFVSPARDRSHGCFFLIV